MNYHIWINSRGELSERPLVEGELRVGRHSDNDLCLSDPDVSSHHCALKFASGQLSVNDLSSSNGTMLNGQRIEHASLRVGDTLQLGGSLLVLMDRALSEGIGAPPAPIKRAVNSPSSRPRTTTRVFRSNLSPNVKTLVSMSVQQLMLVSQRLVSDDQLSGLFETLLSGLMNLSAAERGAVVRRRPDRLEVLASVNLEASALRPGSVRDELLQAAESCRELLTEHRPNVGAGVGLEATTKLELCHLLALPLLNSCARRRRPSLGGADPERRLYEAQGEEIIGSVLLESRGRPMRLDAADRALLKSLASHAAVAAQNAKLYRQATVEPLTKLLNRGSFSRFLEEEITLAERDAKPLGLIMIDLDHFKVVNDRFGHPAGDAVLATVAERLKSRLRRQDLIARYGGEEFAIALPRTDLEGSRRLAESLRCAIADSPVGGSDIRLTASFGIAQIPDHAQQGNRLIQRADQALYEAKRRGRNRVVAWSGSIPALGRNNDPLLGFLCGDVTRDHARLGRFFTLLAQLEGHPDLTTLLREALAVTDARSLALYVGDAPEGLEFERSIPAARRTPELDALAERATRSKALAASAEDPQGAVRVAAPLRVNDELHGALVLELDGPGSEGILKAVATLLATQLHIRELRPYTPGA